jgi:hypothetical protein
MEQVLGVDVQPTVVKDPVMDVPAIDMTDAGATFHKRQVPARKRSTSRAASGRKRRPAAKAKAPSKRTRDGSVGRDTFDQVEALVKEGKTKTEAFKQIADTTGRNGGTVAANYYRVARASGAVKLGKRRAKAAPARATRGRQRAAQSVRRPSSVGSGNGVNGVDQIVGQLVAGVQALTEAVKSQDAEVRELRGRLDKLRGAIG